MKINKQKKIDILKKKNAKNNFQIDFWSPVYNIAATNVKCFPKPMNKIANFRALLKG